MFVLSVDILLKSSLGYHSIKSWRGDSGDELMPSWLLATCGDAARVCTTKGFNEAYINVDGIEGNCWV